MPYRERETISVPRKLAEKIDELVDGGEFSSWPDKLDRLIRLAEKAKQNQEENRHE